MKKIRYPDPWPARIEDFDMCTVTPAQCVLEEHRPSGPIRTVRSEGRGSPDGHDSKSSWWLYERPLLPPNPLLVHGKRDLTTKTGVCADKGPPSSVGVRFLWAPNGNNQVVRIVIVPVEIVCPRSQLSGKKEHNSEQKRKDNTPSQGEISRKPFITVFLDEDLPS